MRKTAYIFMCIVLTTCLYGCKKTTERTITETTANDSIARYERTFVTSDGYTIVDSLGTAPLNTKSTYYDSKKRLIGMAGMASEVTEYNFVRILYNNDGKIEGYLSGCGLESSEDTSDSLTTFMLDPDKNNKNVVRYYLKRDAQGNVIEVSDPITKKKIKAPEGWVIRPEVTENIDFWDSDLNGGFVLLNFYVEPQEKDEKQYSVMKYCFYDLQTIRTYINGVLTKVTVYSPETHKQVAAIEKKQNQMDGTTIYDKSYPGNTNIYRSTWKNGTLLSEAKISQYGTMMYQKLYIPSKDGLAVIFYLKNYDFKTKTLVRTYEKRIDKLNFMVWNKEKNVMIMHEEMSKYWGNQYNVNE